MRCMEFCETEIVSKSSDITGIHHVQIHCCCLLCYSLISQLNTNLDFQKCIKMLKSQSTRFAAASASIRLCSVVRHLDLISLRSSNIAAACCSPPISILSDTKHLIVSYLCMYVCITYMIYATICYHSISLNETL